MNNEINQNNETKQECSLTQNWWTFVLRGILALVIAFVAFMAPVDALLGLTVAFGFFTLIDGVFSFMAAVHNIRKKDRWGWLAFRGIVGVLTGIVVIISPFVASLVLAVFLWSSIAFWSMFAGASEIVTAVRLRKEIKGEIWLMFNGLLTIILGGAVVWLLLTHPAEGFVALGWVLGTYATIFGISMILLGIKLRRSDSNPKASNDDVAPKAST